MKKIQRVNIYFIIQMKITVLAFYLALKMQITEHSLFA